MPKTLTIKDILKKDLLIVELLENGYYEVFKHGIYFKDHLNADRGFIEGSYALLGSADEIKYEDARELVKQIGEGQTVKMDGFKNYKNKYLWCLTATESLLSALESEIYWENPYGKEPFENLQSSTFGGEKTIIHRNPMNILWHEAESRTFDKKRVKIFVKN